MARFVVLGAGAVGQGTARELAGAGHTVRIVSRSGRGPGGAGVEAVRADAADVEQLTSVSSGATAIINALNPPRYTTWERDWPPLAQAALAAAERTGAGLVTVSNLYGYGLVDGPMREDRRAAAQRPQGRDPRPDVGAGPCRPQGGSRARHRAAGLRLRRGRASAPRACSTRWSSPPRCGGGRCCWSWVVADVPHTWTDVPDTARLAAVLATDDRSWGTAWHVPTAAARTIQEVADQVARICGRAPRRVHGIPRGVVTALGLVVPLLRELRETRHQFERPFVLDSSRTAATFDLEATPWEQTLKETVAYLSATAA